MPCWHWKSTHSLFALNLSQHTCTSLPSVLIWYEAASRLLVLQQDSPLDCAQTCAQLLPLQRHVGPALVLLHAAGGIPHIECILERWQSLLTGISREWAA